MLRPSVMSADPCSIEAAMPSVLREIGLYPRAAPEYLSEIRRTLSSVSPSAVTGLTRPHLASEEGQTWAHD